MFELFVLFSRQLFQFQHFSKPKPFQSLKNTVRSGIISLIKTDEANKNNLPVLAAISQDPAGLPPSGIPRLTTLNVLEGPSKTMDQ